MFSSKGVCCTDWSGLTQMAGGRTPVPAEAADPTATLSPSHVVCRARWLLSRARSLDALRSAPDLHAKLATWCKAGACMSTGVGEVLRSLARQPSETGGNGVEGQPEGQPEGAGSRARRASSERHLLAQATHHPTLPVLSYSVNDPDPDPHGLHRLPPPQGRLR